MTTRLPSLSGHLTTFATGPWAATAEESAVDVMVSTLGGKVDGLDLSIRLTSDGVAVVAGSDRIRAGLRRRRIDQLAAVDLPADVTVLTEVLTDVADSAPLLLWLGGDREFEAVVASARTVDGLEPRLWLVCSDHNELIRWRPRTTARLIHATARNNVRGGVEKLLAALHGDDLDGITMPHADWSGGTIALAHRFELLTHASGARHSRELAAVIDAGIDAVSAADAMQLAAVASEFYP